MEKRKGSKVLITLVTSTILLTSLGALPIQAKSYKEEPIHAKMNSYGNAYGHQKNDKIYYSTDNVSEEMDELTPYIDVKNNKFILNLPNDVKISQDLRKKVDSQLKLTNEQIREENYLIDKESKIASPANEIQFYAAGKTSIKFYWNRARVYISAFALRAGLASGAYIAGTYFSGNFLNGVIALATFSASEALKDGIWFDWNYFLGGAGAGILGPAGLPLGITKTGLQ